MPKMCKNCGGIMTKSREIREEIKMCMPLYEDPTAKDIEDQYFIKGKNTCLDTIWQSIAEHFGGGR